MCTCTVPYANDFGAVWVLLWICFYIVFELFQAVLICLGAVWVLFWSRFGAVFELFEIVFELFWGCFGAVLDLFGIGCEPVL